MLEAMKALLPEQLDPYAELFVGALMALLILIVGWIVSKWARAIVVRACKRKRFDEALARFLAAILQYLILAAAVIAALGKVGVRGDGDDVASWTSARD